MNYLSTKTTILFGSVLQKNKEEQTSEENLHIYLHTSVIELA